MTNAGPNGDIDSIRLVRHGIGGQDSAGEYERSDNVRKAGSFKIGCVFSCIYIYARHNMTCDFQERKSVSRAISPYLAGHISSLLVLLDSGSYQCLRFRIQSIWMLAEPPSTMLVVTRSTLIRLL